MNSLDWTEIWLAKECEHITEDEVQTAIDNSPVDGSDTQRANLIIMERLNAKLNYTQYLIKKLMDEEK